MKLIKEFLSDGKYPSDDEVKECLKIVEDEDCIIKLKWNPINNGRINTYTLDIRKGMTFERCVNYIKSTKSS